MNSDFSRKYCINDNDNDTDNTEKEFGKQLKYVYIVWGNVIQSRVFLAAQVRSEIQRDK